MDEMKLELMDWKEVEEQSEKALRENMVMIAINTNIRIQSKIEIHALKGKTSEEERNESEEKAKALEKNTAS